MGILVAHERRSTEGKVMLPPAGTDDAYTHYIYVCVLCFLPIWLYAMK